MEARFMLHVNVQLQLLSLSFSLSLSLFVCFHTHALTRTYAHMVCLLLIHFSPFDSFFFFLSFFLFLALGLSGRPHPERPLRRKEGSDCQLQR